MERNELFASLLPTLSQFEVDFVIPRAGIDLPLGIDPFLLYKSRDPTLIALHSALLTAFNEGVSAVAKGQVETARRILDFPEVPEIGLGYSRAGKRGSGLGRFLSELLVETVLDAPLLQERGVKHVEEMQLLSAGIGPDRVSDIAANVLKSYLIEYTQKQAELWDLPMMPSVPLAHVLDTKKWEWEDTFADLPVSPTDGSAILLVPRRLVRALPWINYDEFFKQEFAAYHRAKRVRGKLVSGLTDAPPNVRDKRDVTAVARRELYRVDRYVAKKEEASQQAQPSLGYLRQGDVCFEADRLKERLASIPEGAAAATEYQRTILEILNFLFNPELIDGEMEVRTFDGTERRDIIFTNDSDLSFWEYLRNEHSGLLLMFETKNSASLEPNHFNQVATYMGDRLGRVAFIVTRNPVSESNMRKAFSVYNGETPRKIILVLTDADLTQMLAMKCDEADPMRYIQRRYRDFRTAVQ